MPEQNKPQGLKKDTFLFKSVQDPSTEFLINIGDKRQELLFQKLEYDGVHKGYYDETKHNHIRVIDGDTIGLGDHSFRLLGIDAPEIDEENWEASRDYIHGQILNAEKVFVVYDKRSDSTYDSYGRHLVWLYATEMIEEDDGTQSESYKNVNLNLLSGFQSVFLMGALDEDVEEIHMPDYRGIEYELTKDEEENGYENPFEIDFKGSVEAIGSQALAKGKPLYFYDDIPQTINIYTKLTKTELSGYEPQEGDVKLPVVELDVESVRVDTHQLYNDLEVPFGVPLKIELNNLEYEKGIYHTEYKPWTKLEDIDGIVFLATIKRDDNEVIYKGMVSAKYFIPLENNRPKFNKAYFKVETYNNNVFKVRYEDLNRRYSMNLLDPDVPGRRDFLGKEATKNEYYTYLIPAMGILNEEGNHVTELAQGREYTFRPYMVVPEIRENEGYDIYAVKWDFFVDDFYHRGKSVMTFPDKTDFPDQGNEQTIYVDTNNDNQHYNWRDEEYIAVNAPNPIISTGWTPSFNSDGQPVLDFDFETMRKYQTIDTFEAPYIYRGVTTEKPAQEDVEPPLHEISEEEEEINYFDEPVSKFKELYDNNELGDPYDGDLKVLYYENSDQDETEIYHLYEYTSEKKTFFIRSESESDYFHNDQKFVKTYHYRDYDSFEDHEHTYTSYGTEYIQTNGRNIKFMIHSQNYDIITDLVGTFPPPGAYEKDASTVVQFYDGRLGGRKLGEVKMSIFGLADGKEVTIDMNHEDVQAIDNIDETKSIRINEIVVRNDGSLPDPSFKGYYHVYAGGDSLEGHLIKDEPVPYMSTSHEIVKEAIRNSRGDLYMNVYLTRASLDEEGKIKESPLELDVMARVNSIMAPIRPQEKKEPDISHGQVLHECRGITSYKGQLVLYDNPKASTTIYLSDIGGNIDYFPLRRALDQFHDDIVHVESVQQGLIVFTNSDIYLVYEEQLEEDTEPVMLAEVVYSNLSIRPHNRNTVRAAGKDVLFMAHKGMYMIRPNPYVEDIRDVFLEEISKGVSDLFEKPLEYAQERLVYYGEFYENLEDKGATVDYYSVVKNDTFWIHASIHIPGAKPFMFIAVQVRENRPHYWKVYDTRAMTFPYASAVFNSEEGHHTLVKNHKTLDGGVTLMLSDSLNLWEFVEDYGKVFDIQTLSVKEDDVEEDKFIYNNVKLPSLEDYQDNLDYQQIKHPIHAALDTGYMDASAHLNKRFNKFYFEMYNVDAYRVPIYIQFNVDGRRRQTSEKMQMQKDGSITYVPKFEQFGYVEGQSMLGLWEIDGSMFGNFKKYKVELGISGRGRLPQMNIGFKATGKFRIYRYGIVFKEQNQGG